MLPTATAKQKKTHTKASIWSLGANRYIPKI